MSVLRQSLALQVMPIDDNPEGLRFQGVLEELEDRTIRVRMDESFSSAPVSETVRVEFTVGNFKFRFDAPILPRQENNRIWIEKPTKIYKSVIRKAPRLELNTPIIFNVWTEPGQHNAILTDLSSVGMKMITTKQLAKNTLLSVVVHIPGKSLRFICQALVRWCNRDLDVEGRYICGVMFTTLSTEATKRVDKFIQDELSKTAL